MRAYLTLLRVEIARFTLDETGVSSRRALRRTLRFTQPATEVARL